MAIWQWRLTFIPEAALRQKYEVLPLKIPMELAEDCRWWADRQPPRGFERRIDMILPPAESWSKEMRMWGKEESDDAYVIYVDESKTVIEEISFRIDARKPFDDLVKQICSLVGSLGCVLMTSGYDILAADESMVLAAINNSTAKKFVHDPVSTLLNLDYGQIRKGIDYFFE